MASLGIDAPLSTTSEASFSCTLIMPFKSKTERLVKLFVWETKSYLRWSPFEEPRPRPVTCGPLLLSNVNWK